MKIIIWNCCRAANRNFRRHVMDLKSTHSFSIMLIMETKRAGDRASNIALSLFPCYHVVDEDGLTDGIWLL
ncbi:hypothetical protein SLA2020_030240 [Shorea laevis]